MLTTSHVTMNVINDKKYFKKEREQHLPGYCQYKLLESTDHDENRLLLLVLI